VIKIIKISLAVAIIFFSSFEVKAKIKDSLFASVENKAITYSDILNEVKIILILSGKPYSESEKQQIETAAIRSVISRNIKTIEVEKYASLTYSNKDLNEELNKYAKNLNISLENLKNIFKKNEIQFSEIVDQIKIELLWNSLIFEVYKDRLTINNNEIEEQLKFIQEKKYTEKYLISEIIIETPKGNITSELESLKKKIETEGFENVAINLSIAPTAVKGGDLGWLEESIISDNFKNKIVNTDIGNISEPIFLKEGILIFKVRDKKKSEEVVDLEKIKDQLINAEKTKILKMHALSHYENVKKSLVINYY